MTSIQWRPDRSAPVSFRPRPAMATAIGHGLPGCHPARGNSSLFKGFLHVVSGLVLVPLLLIVDDVDEPAIWLMTALLVPLTLDLSLGLLRPIKGIATGLALNPNMLKCDVC